MADTLHVNLINSNQSLLCLWLPEDLQPQHTFSIEFFSIYSPTPSKTNVGNLEGDSLFFNFSEPYEITVFFLFYKKKYFLPVTSLVNFKNALIALASLKKSFSYKRIFIPSIKNSHEIFIQEEINDLLMESFCNHFFTSVSVFSKYCFS